MSYGAVSLAKHCTRINSMNRAQAAYDNWLPDEYWNDCIDDEEDTEDDD